MNITLYKTKSENKKMTKALTGAHTLTGTLRNETSITSPRVIVEYNPKDYNYMYISDFGRYYYINDVIQIRTNVWEIVARCDVLMSFASQIKQCKANVIRQQNTTTANPYNFDLASDVHVNSLKKEKYRINFPNSLDYSGLDLIFVTTGNPSTTEENNT